VRASQAQDKLHHVQQALRIVREQLKNLQHELGEEYAKVYGHELERLSSVFIEIDDLNDEKLFGASAEEIGDLELLIQQIEEDAEQFFTPEMTKKIAIMHDHIGFLLKYEKDAELVKRLEKLDERLRNLLQSALESEDESESGGADSQSAHSRVSIPMSEEDIRDLHFLLESGDGSGKMQWTLLLRYLRKFAVRAAKKVFSGRIRLK
jgi:flagellin-specific chaperone FliS